MVDAIAQRAEVTMPEKSNPTAGKWIGAGFGAATSGYFINKNVKTIKRLHEIANSDTFKKAVAKNSNDDVAKIFKESKLPFLHKLSFINIAKAFSTQEVSKIMNDMPAKATGIQKGLWSVATLLTIGVATGLGAFVDHFRKDD